MPLRNIDKASCESLWFSIVHYHCVNTRHEHCNSKTYKSRLKKLSQREFGIVNVGENYNAEPVSNKILLVNSATKA